VSAAHESWSLESFRVDPLSTGLRLSCQPGVHTGRIRLSAVLDAVISRASAMGGRLEIEGPAVMRSIARSAVVAAGGRRVVNANGCADRDTYLLRGET